MSRAGTVEKINHARGMVAIATEDDHFTIIEIISDFEIEIEDEIIWIDDYGLAHQMYKNLTKDSIGEVFVQDHGVRKEYLAKKLLL